MSNTMTMRKNKLIMATRHMRCKVFGHPNRWHKPYYPTGTTMADNVAPIGYFCMYCTTSEATNEPK